MHRHRLVLNIPPWRQTPRWEEVSKTSISRHSRCIPRLDQPRQSSRKPDVVVLNDQHSVNALDAGDAFQSHMYFANGSNQICGLRRRRVRQRGVLGYNRGKIAVPHAHRVPHLSRRRAYGNRCVLWFEREGKAIDQFTRTGIEANDHGFDGPQIDIAPVFNNRLRRSGGQAGLGCALCHGTRDRGHGPDAYEPRSTRHAMRDFRRVGERLHRLQGMPKGSVAIDVILQNPPLPHDLRRDRVKLAAANAEDRLAMSEASVGSFRTQGRQEDCFQVLLRRVAVDISSK